MLLGTRVRALTGSLGMSGRGLFFIEAAATTAAAPFLSDLSFAAAAAVDSSGTSG